MSGRTDRPIITTRQYTLRLTDFMLRFVRKLFGVADPVFSNSDDELSIQLECLEPRFLLSGNVIATMIGADLFLWGDGNDNEVSLEVIDNDIVLVGGNGTTINGTAERETLAENTSTLDGSVFAFMGGGNDQIVIQDGLVVRQSVLLFMGSGDDSVGIGASEISGNLIVVTYSGNNQLALDETVVQQNVMNFTGRGNDVSSIRGATINSNVLIFSGGGDDAVVVDQSNIQGNAEIHTASGNDDIAIMDSSVEKNFFVYTGSGDDFLYVAPMAVAGVSLFLMGSGDDSAVVNGASEFRGTNVFVGGTGNDQLEIDPVSRFEGRQIVVSSESDRVSDSTVSQRLSGEPNGAIARSDLAQQLFGTELVDVELSLDLSANNFVQSNDILVTRDMVFEVAGVTAPGAVVEIDSDSDGQFDDGSFTALADGSFSIDVDLQNNVSNLGANQINVRSTNERNTVAIDTVDVHYAIGSVVRFTSQLGSFDVELSSNPDLTTTVDNFLGYQQRYEGSILHRSAKTRVGGDFVIQGGGFRIENDDLVPIVTDPPVLNQFVTDSSNLRGTIAMALPSNDINGATSQWFINMSDDNVGLDDDLFVVFGRLIGTGIEVADAMHSINSSNISAVTLDSALNEVPLIDFDEFTQLISGSASIQAGQNRLTGLGTSFTTELTFGAEIQLDGNRFLIRSVISDDEAILESVSPVQITDSQLLISEEPEIENYVVFSSIGEILPTV